MNNIKRALLATSVAAAGLTAFASSGSATPVNSYNQVDSFRIERGQAVFGGDDVSGSAHVLWKETGDGVQAHLVGTIHLDEANNQCVRVRMISRDLDGFEQGDRLFSPEDGFCATGNGTFTHDVSLIGDALRMPTVDVTLQKWTSVPGSDGGGHWGPGDTVTVEYGPELPPSDLLLLGEHYDLGGGTLDGDAPSRPGRVTWNVNGWKIEPVVEAKLFVNGAGNERLRVVATCYDANGDRLPGGSDGDLQYEEIEPQGNGAQTFRIQREPCGQSDVREVGVTVERYINADDAFRIVAEQRLPLPSTPGPIDFELPTL